MIYKYITSSNTFIFYLCVSVFYTYHYRTIKKLETKHDIDNDWVYAKVSILEKQIKDNRQLIMSLQNHIEDLNERISNMYYDKFCIDDFSTNNLKIINPDIFYQHKKYYLEQTCKSPYILENTITTATTASTNEKYISPIDNDWTKICNSNEYNV
jgi:hypothetical protein